MNCTHQKKEFFAIKELAQYLNIKVKTLYAWAESGKIPAFKLNGALRFKVSEIMEFIESGKVDPKDPEREAKIILGKRLLLRHNRLDSGQKTQGKKFLCT